MQTAQSNKQRKQQEATLFKQNIKLTNPIHFLAVGLGSGMFSKMPGTMGTIAAIPLWFLFAFIPNLPYGDWIYWLIMFITFIFGCYLCDKTSKDTKTHDSGHIVWDEFVGMWMTLFFIPHITVLWILAAFLLFRLFDIIKPWPIRWFDQRIHGGIGIMIDDVIAGIFSSLCVCFLSLSKVSTCFLDLF